MANNERLILSGMSVLVNHRFENNLAVIIEDKVIKAIIKDDMIKHHLPAQVFTFPANHYLVPGFIDLHVHGAGNGDVMDANIDSLQTISQKLAAEGVTGFLATTMTASHQRIEEALAVIPQAAPAVKGAAILGVHLEGPFISREKAGAQLAGDACLPDLQLFNAWQKIAEGLIRLVTIAPELDHALEFITALAAKGVLLSVGHSNATYEQTMQAVAAGCGHATHLFNAMRSMHQREPGASGALLLSNAITAELLVDGMHLHPAMCELAWRVKGRDHLLLVTDAIRAKCMGDGTYELGGQAVTVTAGKATLADGTLAGSVLTMPHAIKNMMTSTNCALEDVLQLASYNPARQLNLLAHKGTIEAGKDADLVVMTDKLEVLHTIRAGKIIFSGACAQHE